MKPVYIEAPDIYEPQQDDVSVFLAGGISGCVNWQEKVAGWFSEQDYYNMRRVIVLNPRRKNFDVNDENVTVEQIKWEHKHLKIADIIMFWFPKDTLCPITLFEYGKCLVGNKKIVVGCDSEYKRVLDLEVQTKLEQPNIWIQKALKHTFTEVLDHLKYLKFVARNGR